MTHTWSKRAIQFIPLLIVLGITAGIGTGIGGIASSASYYNQLPVDITNDVEQVARSIVTTQDQLDSLASVVLQNRRGLDLITAEKGGLCIFLNEECCFYVNQRHGSTITGHMLETGTSKFLEQMEQHPELGLMASTLGWSSLHAPIDPSVWPLHSQCHNSLH
jgi:hypothetical protein